MIFTDRYICPICGHVYNPGKGEPKQNLKTGIDFSALPDDWACPVCFAPKGQFRKEE